MDIKDKVAIVTGASSGIGYEIARALAEKKAYVVLTARRIELLNNHVKHFKKEYGIDCVAIATDLSDEGSIDNLVKRVYDLYKGIDILVNAAGQFLILPPTLSRDYSGNIRDFNQLMEVNLNGAVRLIFRALPYIRKGGVVINVSSEADRVVHSNELGYLASKAALSHLTRGLNIELSDTVNFYAISPGNVNTDMLRKIIESNSDVIIAVKKRFGSLDEFYSKILQPRDIAKKAVYLIEKRPKLKDVVVYMKSVGF